jgi:hypothetical protein
MVHFQSPDVMRFLGRKANGNFTSESTTSFKVRAEGVRVKHWVRGNQLTERGRLLTPTLRATRDANIQRLLREAA